MKIIFETIESNPDESYFNILNADTNEKIGILFTVLNHIAYEIKPEFRCQGAATQALIEAIKNIKRPILEITFNNLASIKVAKKAGFSLKRVEGEFGIYEYNGHQR